MAAFSALALVGVGLLVGTALARRKKQGQQTLAPGPTGQVEAITPPTPPVIDPGQQQATAQQAGVRQRKRAAAGSLLTNPQAPTSSLRPIAARLQPRSLLGS